jgi:hypothetical protein
VPFDPLESAVRRLDECKSQLRRREADAQKIASEIAGLKRERDELEMFIATYRRLSGEPVVRRSSGGPPAVPNRHGPPAVRQGAKRYDYREIRDAARAVLREAKRPLSREPLLEALVKRGLLFGGKNKARNLGTMMWRMREEFVNIEGEGYWPKDLACPAIGYVPSGNGSSTAGGE